MNKKHAVVLGRNYSSLLGMIRAAGLAGCEVGVVRTDALPASGKSVKKFIKRCLGIVPIEAESKYVKKYLTYSTKDTDGLVDLLLNEFSRESEKVILLPTDDFVASAIDLHQDRLRDAFVFPNIDQRTGAVVELMDKFYQKGLARRAGLPVAKGWTISISDGVYTIPNDIEYPCFTKPEISYQGSKRWMKRCNDSSELEEVLKSVAGQTNCELLVEQFVEIEKEYGVLGYCDGERAHVPAIVHKLAIGSGPHRGVTLLGKVLPADKYPEIQNKISEMIEATGFVGLFDVDLYENNGTIYFNELNLRLGAFGYSILCSGINLPGMLIRKLCGETAESVPMTVEQEIVCLNDKVNLEDFLGEYITWDEYRKVIQKADYRFIEAPNDNGPKRAYVCMERLHRVKRMLKK